MPSIPYAAPRAFLKMFIDRVEVGDWKSGMTCNANRRRDDTDESYKERQTAARMTAVAERVKIVWKWEAGSAGDR
jgi:hypothetical protein